MKVEIEIEKSVPLPPANIRPGGIRDTVRKMKVGDSIVVDNRNFCGKTAQITGYKLASRRLDDGRFRVWRVK